MIVVRKDIDVTTGQQLLFSTEKYFFYITNEPADQKTARDVIHDANRRCDQENTISQLKNCHALAAPLDNLESNWAYMLFASLAWTLKTWSGMLVRVKGNLGQRRARRRLRDRVLKMEFSTYLNSLMQVPAQLIRSSRQLKFRILTYRLGIEDLFALSDHIALPLRL